MRGLGSILFVCVGGLALLETPPAWGYVREVTKLGVPIAWRSPCVDLHLYIGSPPPVLSVEEILAAGTQATAAWSYPQVPATDIRLGVVAEADPSATIGYDHRNVITFRSVTWCRDPAPLNDAGMAEPECYPPSALAVTSLFKNTDTGEILDTDIEFNAVDYAWADLLGGAAVLTANTADFQNALTHELGHVVGLDHNCFTTNDGQARLNDNTGSPEVDCYGNPDLPDVVAQATMYPSVVLSDTSRRSLSPDDALGVSDIYPHAHESCPVPVPSDGGCNLAAPPPPRSWPNAAGATGVALLAAVAFWRGRQRAARRRKDASRA